MLTKDLIKSNTVLAELSEDQLNAIVTLSKNDEDAVFGKFSADHWRRLDEDLQEITGIQKEYGVKSHEHLKKVVTQLKKKADTSNTEALHKQIDDLTTTNAQLNKTIKEGATDSALKTKVSDLEKQLADKDGIISKLRTDIKTVGTDYQKQLEVEAAKNVSLKFENEYSQALVGVSFKKGIPQSAIDATLREAKRIAMEKGKPEFVKDANGVEKIQYRDANGHIITNPENLQKPITPKEVFLSGIAELIDTGSPQPGTGLKDKPGSKSTLDLSGVQTRVEADNAIREYLVGIGESPSKQTYVDKYQEIYTENNVQELPMSL